MTLGEMQDIIDEAERNGGSMESELVIAHQPGYPMQLGITDYAWIDPRAVGMEEESPAAVVLAAAGSEHDIYLSSAVCEALGWR